VSGRVDPRCAALGSNEAVAVSIAEHGLPISVVADDSSFPELFEHLRANASSGA
jgi:hypothetical protein